MITSLYLLRFLEYLLLLLPLFILFIFYYFFIFKPQQQKQTFLSRLRAGMKIATKGGLIGKIVKLGNTYCTIELEDGTLASILKKAITSIIHE